MKTTEEDCVASLQRAANHLGTSPSKAQYESLGWTPASATIIRVMGGWNTAKEIAGLETNPSTGPLTTPKPADVELPDDVMWEELSVDQRWHYRNVEWNSRRTRMRRTRLRAWTSHVKQTTGCAHCDETNPACLDFHHLNNEEKHMEVGQMVTYGYGKSHLKTEMAKCIVLCSNCHRKEHYEPPTFPESAD